MLLLLLFLLFLLLLLLLPLLPLPLEAAAEPNNCPLGNS